MRRLAAEEQKRKKDEAKRWARKKMVAHDLLEKRRRAQAREGLPLESSPSTEEEEDDDDDDDEGMEVRVVFRPEVGFSSAPASTGPSDGASPPAQGLAASLSGALASAQLAPIPTKAEEAEVVKGETVLLPVEAVVVPAGAPTGPLSGRPLGGTWRRGLSLPPFRRLRSHSGPSYHSALGPHA